MEPDMTIIIRPCSLHRKRNIIQCDITTHIFFIIHGVELTAAKLQAAKKQTNKQKNETKQNKKPSNKN